MRKISIIAFLLAAAFMRAQNPHEKFDVFSFRFDNDFVFGTDRYFTNGFDFAFASSSFAEFSVNSFLFPKIKNERAVYTLHLVQKIYTPQEKESLAPVIGDRPFSANLYLVYEKTATLEKGKSILNIGFLLGVMGKYAFGEEVQNGIHSLLPPSGEVLGWDNQLSPAPLFAYRVGYKNLLARKSFLKTETYVEGEIGQPDTRIGAGIFFIAGTAKKRNELFASDKFSWRFVFKPKLIFVFYNANLQGGIFTENIYEISSRDITRTLFNLQNELDFFYGKTNLSLGYEMLTKEFSTGKAHLWFYTKITYKF